MSEPKRMHPAGILFNFFKVLRETIFPIVFGFVTFRNESMIYFLLAGAAVLVIMIVSSILSWYRFTYRVEDGELRIEYGVFIRKKRFISVNRIQSIDLTSGVIHRVFGLTKVQIETAGSGMQAEASLKAVKLPEAEQLRDELKSKLEGDLEESLDRAEEESEDSSHRITFQRLFLAGTTSGSAGVVLAVFAFFFSQIQQFIPERFYDSTVDWVVGLSIVLLVGFGILVLLLLWVLGIAGTMLKYGNFTITKKGDELFITRGLLEKKQITIPLKRIQAVGFAESPIRQPFGYASVFAEVAGGSLDKGEEFSTVLFPIMKREEVEPFLQDILPDYAGIQEGFEPLPRRAGKFYMLRAVLPFLLVGAVIWFVFSPLLWAVLLLATAALCYGYLQYRDTGFLVKGNRLSMRYRTFGRITVRMFHKRVQAFEIRQHKLQQMQSLATQKVSIIGKFGAGKHYYLKQLDESDAIRLAEWYSYRDGEGQKMDQ
ncbi:PH domain-containing protein [Virgibacillus xinjiangensis]|uniref:PH domain-containing protein n=1 Tax=Virgibacillus xinjiangensis TaxID=393090 RepID=A0ABV7CSD4_9BACI